LNHFLLAAILFLCAEAESNSQMDMLRERHSAWANAIARSLLRYEDISLRASHGAKHKNQAQSLESYTSIVIFLLMRKSETYINFYQEVLFFF
jgi:hypothetical protein